MDVTYFYIGAGDYLKEAAAQGKGPALPQLFPKAPAGNKPMTAPAQKAPNTGKNYPNRVVQPLGVPVSSMQPGEPLLTKQLQPAPLTNNDLAATLPTV